MDNVFVGGPPTKNPTLKGSVLTAMHLAVLPALLDPPISATNVWTLQLLWKTECVTVQGITCWTRMATVTTTAVY